MSALPSAPEIIVAAIFAGLLVVAWDFLFSDEDDQ